MSHGHYFDSDPSVPSQPHEVELSLPGFRARLQADRGVFSASGIDRGTLELLRAIPAPPTAGDLLDLGCGYGPIACTLAHRAPDAVVWAVDINDRALALTARNAQVLDLPLIRPVRPEMVPESVGFAGIWSNPPIRIGKLALHDLLDAWLPRLTPGGQAWLVVQRHLGADSLADWLGTRGWRVTRMASKRGYRILNVGQR